MSEILVESIIKYISPTKEIKIRVWRKELYFCQDDKYDIIEFINNYIQKYTIWYPEKMGENLLNAFVGITKVEILDKNDCGILLTKI